MKIRLTMKHKLQAYILNQDFGYSQKKIGDLMGVNQSTISNAIKEIRYEKEIHDLRAEIEDIRNELRNTIPAPKPIIFEIPDPN